MKVHSPLSVMPTPLGRAVEDIPHWFVIGGQAVRCFCPYRPSRDVDFGVGDVASLRELVTLLRRRGAVEIVEKNEDTIHLRFEGINVSIFVLEPLVDFIEERRLTVTGILATKMHAILDRGARRDFFDLYVTLQQHSLGIVECLVALRRVYQKEIDESLLLRALTYFDDAEREARIPGEGSDDWTAVKDFFLTRVGQLIVPPMRRLEIQERVVDVRESAP